MTINVKIENTNGEGSDKAVVVRFYDNDEIGGPEQILESGESAEVVLCEGRTFQIDEIASQTYVAPVVEAVTEAEEDSSEDENGDTPEDAAAAELITGMDGPDAIVLTDEGVAALGENPAEGEGE